MEQRMQKLKEQPNKQFGGVYIVFCGESYQLTPAGGDPFYSFLIDS